MILWMNRITMTDEAAALAYAGSFPTVNFTYIHKNGRETTKRMKLDDAIRLAEARREDGRYRNFEFHIG